MRSTRTVLSLAAVAASWLCIPATASAQAPAPAAEEGEKKSVVEEMVVTGTRVRRKDLTTPAPVTVVSREQVVASGKVSIGDFLQTLPEQGNGINTSVNNGGDGSTRINLRGIGSARTLVLMNGRRLMPGGTGADSSADLNTIPSAAIERIEILKDGASAVYGSDAISGVVNIITRKGWNGTEASAYTGTSSRGDGTTYDLNLTSGTSSDTGSIVFSAGFYDQKRAMAGDRDFSKIPLAYCANAPGQTIPNDPNNNCTGGTLDGLTGVYSQGSGTIPAGRVSASGAATAGNALWSALKTAYPTAGNFIYDPNAPAIPGFATPNWRPFLGTRLANEGGDGYNFQPENYLVTPQQRMSLYAAGDLRIGSFARGFFEATYMNRQSGQDLAPEPFIIGPGGEPITMSANSLYNPFGKNFTAARRRLTEFGRRQQREDLDAFRVVGGVDGTLPEAAGPLKGWFWDLSLNYGRTQGTFTKRGNLRVPRIADAIGPSMLVNGVPTCVRVPGDATTAIDGCVPLNILHTAIPGGDPNGTITADQVAGLTFTGTSWGTNQLGAFQANASGELFRLMSERPVGLAAGFEHREVAGSFINDPITAAGETTGNKGFDTRGSYNVNELYGELSIPVVSGMSFADDIELSAAVRWFKYSTFGSDSTYKFGGRWRPIRDVTLRGTYSTAFRAPSISDLFLGQSDNFAPVSDPCRGPPNGPPLTPTQLITCGTAANNGDTNSQLRSRIGGNPDLTAETAKIFTAGIVFEPTMVKNLSVTVDYFSVDIDKNIGTIGESVILAGCYDGTSPQYCSFIQRDPINNNQISNITNLNTNVGKLKTSGIDLAVRYALPSDFGRWSFALDGAWLQKIDQTLADGTVIKGKNTFDLNNLNSFGGAGGSFPAWKFNAAVLWAMKGWGAGLSSRFLGSFHECGDSGGDFSGSGLCYVDSTYQRKISAYHTEDIFVGYTLSSSAGKTNLTLGMQNMFDAKPSKIYNGFIAATDAYNYDLMGRFMYVRLTHNY